jgi:hypothetical protein
VLVNQKAQLAHWQPKAPHAIAGTEPDHVLIVGCAPLASQDVLVVTAPGSGAEIIPFLKTWVNLPMAIGFTILYAKVSQLLWAVTAGVHACSSSSWSF